MFAFIGNTGVNSGLAGLAFDQVNDVLYMVADPDGFAAGSSNLYRLNVLTGAAILVGSTGVSAIDGLAWRASVPEPTSLLLISIALAGLGFSRRNAHRTLERLQC